MDLNRFSVVRFVIENLVDSAYCVGYRKSDKSFWEEECSLFKLIKPTFRYWYADPIPYVINDKQFVFVEKYDRMKQIGYIGVSHIKANGKAEKPKTIIKGKTHLSFPMIICFKGKYYMFPESSFTNSIEIYQMCDTPYQWEHYYSIKTNSKVVDIVYKEQNNNVLLLAGIEDENSPLYVKRQIIELKDLDDVRKLSYKIGYTDKVGSLMVRNGGPIFNECRIVQESTKTDYGMYLRLNKIIYFELNGIKESFIKKKTVDNVDVHLNNFLYRKIGIHTYGRNNNFEVIDLSVTRLSILPFLRKCGFI